MVLTGRRDRAAEQQQAVGAATTGRAGAAFGRISSSGAVSQSASAPVCESGVRV